MAKRVKRAVKTVLAQPAAAQPPAAIPSAHNGPRPPSAGSAAQPQGPSAGDPRSRAGLAGGAAWSRIATGPSAEQIAYAAARENLALYASMFLRGPPAAPYNGKFVVARHHRAWADLVNEHRRLLILASRSSGKTFFFSLAYMIWMAEKLGAGHRAALFGGSEQLANENLAVIRNEIETNPKLEHLLPKEGGAWRATKLELGNGYTMVARGMGTESRGIHPHVLCCDDILPSDTLFIGPEGVKQQITFFHSTIDPMLEPGGQMVVIGTPFLSTDVYAEMEKDPSTKVVRFPAIDASGAYLWAERLTPDVLARARARSEIIFQREYMCRPVGDDASMFPAEFFYRPGVQRADVEFGRSRSYYDARCRIRSVHMGVDFAFSQKTGADYTVITTIGVDPDQNVWMLDMQRVKGLGYEEQKALIIERAAVFHPDSIFTESNQAQRLFGDSLIAESQLPITQYHTGAEKHSLDRGIPSVRPLFENTKVRIPAFGGLSPVMETWISEMTGMAVEGGRVISTTPHDDTAMSAYLAILAMRKSAQFSFSFGADESDAAAARELWGDPEPSAQPADGTRLVDACGRPLTLQQVGAMQERSGFGIMPEAPGNSGNALWWL